MDSNGAIRKFEMKAGIKLDDDKRRVLREVFDEFKEIWRYAYG